MSLTGKVALVTGSAQGIGLTCAERLARDGCNIVIADIDNELADKTASEIIDKFKVEVLSSSLDVTNFDQVAELVKKILDKWGRIDILINNAGITKDDLLIRMKEDAWDKVLAVNLKGSFNCIKACVRPMMKRESGRIVNIASVVGQMGNAGQANYSASKGGLIALTKTCAREFASRKITVNAVAPGFIRTRMTEVLSEEVKQKLSEQIPLQCLGEPMDIANAVAFLSSDEASYITGQVVAVNGGMYM
ncbi:MAG: 3-oxoacyl-[acyl-carrier-protein] reductase [bacterium]